MGKILLIEPFLTGSHENWALEFQKFSKHEVEILSLPGRFWKWRMYGGAVELARQFEALDFAPDLILASDMLDLSTFLALSRNKSFGIPVGLYFHENQLTYPWKADSEDKLLKRDRHYAFVNYSSALSADRVFFNSVYHREAFLGELPQFLSAFPDFQGLEQVEGISSKSQVLSLGLDLRAFEALKREKEAGIPIVLWNHRWEHDKNPEEFFSLLYRLKEQGRKFRLIVLGESFKNAPGVFAQAREKLKNEIMHWGFAPSFEQYAALLWISDIIPITSRQDFFGISLVQAMYCGALPLLPDRLVFPEHLPPAFREQLLYEDEEELYSKMIQLLEHPESKEGIKPKDWVEKYDWDKKIEQYDEAFESMIQNVH